MNNDLFQTLKALLKYLGYNISHSDLRNQVFSHPEYPALSCVSDTLEYFEIKHMPLRIEKPQLFEMPLPFLAHLGINGGQIILIRNKSELRDFNEKHSNSWDGVVFGFPGVHKNYSPTFNISGSLFFASLVFLLLMFFTLGLFFPSSASFSAFALTIIAFIINILILQKELLLNQRFLKSICQANGESCATTSPVARKSFLKDARWSDLGLTYFLCNIIFLGIGFIVGTTYIFKIVMLSYLIVFPFAFYSIYYQIRFKKKCILCLGIVLALSLNAGIAFLTINEIQFEDLRLIRFALVYIVFLISLFILWTYFMRNSLQLLNKIREGYFSLIRFKNSKSVVNAVLSVNPTIKSWKMIDPIKIMSNNESVKMVVVCGPYCTPCKITHSLIYKLGQSRNLDVEVRFAVHSLDTNDKNFKAISFILNVLKAYGDSPEKVHLILSDWFETMNLNIFYEKYPGVETVDPLQEMKIHYEWTKYANIQYTPTILVNGKLLPEDYSYLDLPLIIDQLD